MIVVADTSPVNYLIQIDSIGLLPQLYDQILVPNAVFAELTHSHAPLSVRTWAANRPAWLEVRLASSQADPALAFLDRGEREAIQIALDLHADRLLIDEFNGRAEAVRRGLIVTGTLGILLTAGKLQLADPEAAYRRLIADTNFRTSADLKAEFLRLVRPRP